MFSAVLLISDTLPHNILIWLTVGACAVGSYIGGYTSSQITKHNALITGILSGSVIFLTLSAAGLIWGNSFTYITAVKLLIILLLSIVGAIKGVNKKEKLHIK